MCIQEEGGNDCGGSRQEGLEEELPSEGEDEGGRGGGEELRVGEGRRTASHHNPQHSYLSGQRGALHPVFNSNFTTQFGTASAAAQLHRNQKRNV